MLNKLGLIVSVLLAIVSAIIMFVDLELGVILGLAALTVNLATQKRGE